MQGKKIAGVRVSVLLAAASIVVMWPMAFSVIKIASEYYTPLAVVVFRLLISMVVMLLYVVIRRYPIPRGRDFWIMASSGISGVWLYAHFVTIGVETVPAGEVAFLVAVNPLFVAVAGWMFYGENVGIKTTGGMCVALSGVGVITLEHGLKLEVGALFGLAAAGAFAVYILMHKPLLERYSPDLVAAYSTIFGSAPLLFFLPSVWEQLLWDYPQQAYTSLIYLGGGASAIGLLMWSYVLQQLPRIQAASIMYLLPFSASLNAVWLIGEVMEAHAWIGGALIITGVAIINIRRAKKLGDDSAYAEVEV